jgi:hypothetical protein
MREVELCRFADECRRLDTGTSKAPFVHSTRRVHFRKETQRHAVEQNNVVAAVRDSDFIEAAPHGTPVEHFGERRCDVHLRRAQKLNVMRLDAVIHPRCTPLPHDGGNLRQRVTLHLIHVMTPSR